MTALSTPTEVLSLPAVPATLKGFRDLPESRGVYFVVNTDDQILYIGRSKNIQSRWFSHHKKYLAINAECKVFYFEAPDHIEINDLEKSLIELFNPCWNNNGLLRAPNAMHRLTVMIPDELMKITAEIKQNPPLSVRKAWTISTSSVFRLALQRGLDQLAAEARKEGIQGN